MEILESVKFKSKILNEYNRIFSSKRESLIQKELSVYREEIFYQKL
jgi:hypothetical protein